MLVAVHRLVATGLLHRMTTHLLLLLVLMLLLLVVVLSGGVAQAAT